MILIIIIIANDNNNMIIIVNDNAQLVVYAPINTTGSFCISVVNFFLSYFLNMELCFLFTGFV